MYKYAEVIKYAEEAPWYEQAWNGAKDFFSGETGQRLLHGGAGALGTYLLSGLFTKNKGARLLMSLAGGGLAGWKGYDLLNPYVQKLFNTEAEQLRAAKNQQAINNAFGADIFSPEVIKNGLPTPKSPMQNALENQQQQQKGTEQQGQVQQTPVGTYGRALKAKQQVDQLYDKYVAPVAQKLDGAMPSVDKIKQIPDNLRYVYDKARQRFQQLRNQDQALVDNSMTSTDRELSSLYDPNNPDL